MRGPINDMPTDIYHITEVSNLEADEFLGDHPDTAARIQRVTRLIEGFESPYGMELLATVHWVGSESGLPARDEDSAVEAVHAWSARKQRLFRPDHIRQAWRRLQEADWLEYDES